MTLGHYLRTIDLARATHISVQQVRNYEADGLIPPAERSPSGYRRYTHRHLVALQTVRQLIVGYGWQRAQIIMQAMHQGRRGDALAAIDARHAELASTRLQLEQTLAALNILTTQLSTAKAGSLWPRRVQPMRVSAAAALASVPVSSLRFWERLGLLLPKREAGNRYRLYDEAELRRLRIVALLRQANHDFATIRTTLDELEAGKPQQAVAAVEQRRHAVAELSWRCVQAMAALYDYANEYYPTLSK